MKTKIQLNLFKHLAWRMLILATALTLVTYSLALAASGDLDPTFDGDGKLTTSIAANDEAWGLVIQPDQKIVAVGKSWACIIQGCHSNFVLVRYLPDGALDTTFGEGGKVSTDFGDWDEAYDAAIQPDGKLVVVGQICYDDGTCDLAVARYNTDGSLDPTFSGDGKLLVKWGSKDNGSLGGVALQSNGKIVIAGYMLGSNSYNFAIYRLNANGTLDNTFSGDGKTSIGFASGRNEYAYDLSLSDGKIIVAGETCDLDGFNCNFAIARLNLDGSLDPTFSSDGKVVTNFYANDSGYALAIQTDGKILLGGSKRGNTEHYFALARYNPNGSLDTTFSGDGKVTTNMSQVFGDAAQDLNIQSDGKILAGGWVGGLGTADFALARYNPNGSLDTTFSGDGKVTTDFGGTDGAYAIALQASGKILLAGSFDTIGDYSDFALARYLP